MKPRRKAREAALQVLFQKEFQKDSSPKELFNSFADNFLFDDIVKGYAFELTQGVITNLEDVNQIIEKYSDNWRIDRIASIDRILLQIAIVELCFIENQETPAKICISDIIDLAKKYSSQDSKKFINGILDQVYQQQIATQ